MFQVVMNLCVEPTEAAPLLFGQFSGRSKGAGVAMLAARGDDRIQKRDGSGIGSAEGSGFDTGEKGVVTNTSEWRKVGVGNGDAIGAEFGSLAGAFDRLTQTAAEGDRDEDVLLCEGAGEMVNASGGYGAPNGKIEDGQLVVEISRQNVSEVAGNDSAAAGADEKGRETPYLVQGEVVLESGEVLEVRIRGGANE